MPFIGDTSCKAKNPLRPVVPNYGEVYRAVLFWNIRSMVQSTIDWTGARRRSTVGAHGSIALQCFAAARLY